MEVIDNDIHASGRATLTAEDQINILAARNDQEQHTTQQGSAGSLDISYGTSGLMVNASASASRGHADGTDTSYTNSHVSGGQA